MNSGTTTRKRARQKRNERGASLWLVAGAACLLAYLVYLGFQYVMLSGGSREVRNAVDASVLNISKNVIGLRVPPGSTFMDCADSSGSISMANINRLWGKAYLINANVEEMKKESLANGPTIGAGEQAYALAEQVNNNLRGAVTDRGMLNCFFKNLASKRTAVMLGNASINHTEDANFPVALVDRGAESNLSFNHNSLPKFAKVNEVGAGKTTFVQGYSSFTANGKTFCFTPYRIGEQPHLIADSYFSSNRADSHAIPDFPMAIPNAFQGFGTADSGTQLSASASAIANPQRQYQMTIPHAFIKVRFTSAALWFLDDKQAAAPTPYNQEMPRHWGIKDKKLPDDRVFNGWATIGKEYNRPSLYQVIMALNGNKTDAFVRMAQRACEIDPSYSVQRVIALLEKQKPDPTQPPGLQTFYIFPRYTSSDRTDPQLDIAPEGKNLPGWLQKVLDSEGESKDITKEPIKVDETSAFCYITGSKPDCVKWLEISGSVRWRPGTGMMQCLGILYVDRVTKVKFYPMTEPPPTPPQSQ